MSYGTSATLYPRPNTVTLKKGKLALLQKRVVELATMRAQVGVFSEHDAREDGGSNASIGADHEFGVPENNLPMRSFLRAPLMTKVDVSGIDWADKVMRNPKQALEVLGNIGVETVDEAFASGGFGEWPDIQERTKKRKGFDSILIETADLRGSVASRAV